MEPEITNMPGGDLLTRLGIKLYRYKGQLKHRWWVLALAVSIGIVVESYLVWKEPVKFESSGSLQVSGQFDFGQGKYQDERAEFYGTQLKMLQSGEVRDRATRRLALENPKLHGTIESTANIIAHTSIFSVKGVGSNPEYTQSYVNAQLEEFLEYKREQLDSETNIATQQLAEGIAIKEKEIAALEKEFQKFMEENNMKFWEEESKNAAHYLSELKTKQANLNTELGRIENLTPEEMLNTQQFGNAPSTGQSNGSQVLENNNTSGNPGTAILSNELNQQYNQKQLEISRKQSEMEQMSKVWKPKHPRLIALGNDVASLQRDRQAIVERMNSTGLSRISAVKAELKSLAVSIEGWEKKVTEASHKDAEYQTRLAAVKAGRESRDKLLVQLSNMQSIKTTQGGGFFISEHASVPHEVPREILKHLLIGLVLGFLAGSIILFILDRADDRFSSSTEIIEQFNEPILAQIPDVSNSRDKTGLPLLQPDDDRYVFAEALRSLRSSLVFMPNQGELKTLLVSSSVPGEGKSTISSNFAITMAQAGAKVLLVDADLRRGDLAGFFDVDGRFGFTNVLREEMKWQSVAHSTKYPTLTLIPRGPVTNQSGELLLAPFLETLLSEFKQNYDLVIFNTPPVLATDDTSTLAPHFDGTLMVLRAHYTSARMLKNTLNTMRQRQVNVLGLILNCIDVETPGYYYYRYPKYYAA